MDKWFAIGWPIGPTNQDSEYTLRCGGQLYTLTSLCYGFWLDTMAGKPAFDESDEIQQVRRQLYRNGLICKTMKLPTLVPVRQGVGAGYHHETQDYVIIASDGDIHVTWSDYLLWIMADGHETLSELHEKLHDDKVNLTMDNLIAGLTRLYDNGAVVLDKARGEKFETNMRR